MTADLSRWPEADAILDAALALPSGERDAYVRRVATDSALVAALTAVLAEAETADDFLAPAGAWSGTIGSELRAALDHEGAPTLPQGVVIEHYRVIEPIGRGGMGEVYRAHDGRLARDVALKVLPARYARDAERRARFQREARLLASLNHPGIAAIYGIAESEDVEALVLEFVDGPTLAETIAAGPRPLAEVNAIASALVDAIGAAHARGILHRDLKPANIKVTSATTIKILDFGLARMLAPEDVPAESAADLTRPSTHVLLGTASYMSPEQARGHHVDERTDIWAFGCVVFEMLTGARAFSGASVADVLAAVIEREPAFSLLPPETPEPIRRLLRRCLEKDRDRRLGYIGDARLELGDAAAMPVDFTQTSPAPRDGVGDDGTMLRPRTAAAIALVALVIGAGAATWFFRSRPAPTPPTARLMMLLPAGDQPVTGFQPMTTLSPDGRTVVYRARRGTTTQLFRRDLDALEPIPIAGTEGATNPFFSPDGRWLAFDGDGVLKRVATAGGTPVTICSAPGGLTAAWLSDDTIVFATNTSRVLQQVPASGGTPEPITSLDRGRGETLHLLPQALPGARAVLFTVVTGAARHVAVLDLTTRTVRTLTEGSQATFIAPDAIVFVRDGSLWGAGFDPERLVMNGNAIPMEERVAFTNNTVFHYAVAGNALVYLAPQSSAGRQRLVWIDRSGREMPVGVEPRGFVRVSLAPDNQRFALSVDEDGNQDIWIADPARETMSRLTFEPTIEAMPTWSPDGRFVAFRSEREGPGLFRRLAAGTGTAERLTTTDGPIHSPYSWTPDGKTLLFAIFRSFRHQEIGSVTPPDPNVRVLLTGDYAQLDPQVSPDGKWLAYQSDETGRFEIYVRPYPDVDEGRWVVSSAGGTSPRWSPDGRELFYHDGDALVSVPVRTAAGFSMGRPVRLFAIKPFGGRLGPDFEIASDAQRFLFLTPDTTDSARSASLVFIQNWADALRARLARQP